MEQWQEKGILANTVEDTVPQEKRRYIIGVDDEALCRGIMDGTIPSTIADSGAISGVGTEDDPSHHTGEPSDKQFILPSGKVIQATEKAEYPFNVREPANKLHITPGISQHSLLSTGKYADANYITVFDKDTINVYDSNNTIITVTRDAILRGWRPTTNCGASHWWTWSKTKTLTLSLSTDPQLSFCPIAHPPKMPSTTFTSWRRHLN